MSASSRSHQLLVVDPRWVDEAVDETKTKLLKAMTSAEPVVKKWKCMPEFLALKRCHANPWDPPMLKDILAGKASSLNSYSGTMISSSLLNLNEIAALTPATFDFQITSSVNATKFA